MPNPMPTAKIKRDQEPLAPAAVLTHGDVAEIARLLSRNFTLDNSNAIKEELIAAVRSLTSMSVEGVEIKLEPRLLQRLRTRCLKGNDFPGWLREVVIKQLHDYAGW